MHAHDWIACKRCAHACSGAPRPTTPGLQPRNAAQSPRKARADAVLRTFMGVEAHPRQVRVAQHWLVGGCEMRGWDVGVRVRSRAKANARDEKWQLGVKGVSWAKREGDGEAGRRWCVVVSVCVHAHQRGAAVDVAPWHSQLACQELASRAVAAATATALYGYGYGCGRGYGVGSGSGSGCGLGSGLG